MGMSMCDVTAGGGPVHRGTNFISNWWGKGHGKTNQRGGGTIEVSMAEGDRWEKHTVTWIEADDIINLLLCILNFKEQK